MDNNEDNNNIYNATEYFRHIVSNDITNEAEYKIGATFIGIRTNISGNSKLHIYIILFPFMEHNEIPNPNTIKVRNLFCFTDVCVNVDKSFYLWMYEEMRKQNGLIIMSLDDNVFKVVGGFGDSIISIDKNCEEKKDWMDLEFEDWYKKHTFNNVFTITITNPYFYMVPFPVKPTIVKTQRKLSNYCDFYIADI